MNDSAPLVLVPPTALLLQPSLTSITMSDSQRSKQLPGESSDRLRSPTESRLAAGRRHLTPSHGTMASASAPSYQPLDAIESVRTANANPNGGGHEVILSGTLFKRGQIFKTWLPRYLVLSRDALHVYRKNPYMQQQEKDVAQWEKKLLKMEVVQADGIRVEATDAFKNHPFCFVLIARKRSRHLGPFQSSGSDGCAKKSRFFSRAGCRGFQHRNLSNIDSSDGPVVLYYFEASKDTERQRWIRALQRWMEDTSPTKLGRGILNYIVNNDYSNHRYGKKVVESSSKKSVGLVGDSGLVLSPASHAGRSVEQEFPVLANLIRDLHDCKKEDEMIYILDQVFGEVQDGANSSYIKKLISTAGEAKLEESAHIWTTHVKTAYATIMKALQSTPSEQEPSSQAPTLRAPNYAMRQHSGVSIESSGSNQSLRTLDVVSFHRFYKLGRKLGSGAFSVVHIATHRETRKQVAVKCIAKVSLGSQDVGSLKQEVEVMSSLNHPNLVPLLDYFEEDRYYYIVTPLCTGGELFDDLVKRKSYTEEDARVLMRKLASAIDYLHSRGIVHRDLKPENILLKTSAPGAEIMIADFGFARSMNGSRRGTACGTPGYVAPEVVRGEPYGAEVDCWSLGVILYILLCGYPPFPGANHATVLDKVVKAEYTFEVPYWDGVSDEAKDLVMELLTVDRTKRLNASGILAHPWMDEVRASAMGMTDDTESRKRFTRKCSDLLPALHQMRKHSLTHGSPKIRPSDMNVDDIELDELTMNSDKETLERELADMEGL
ncbi:hypothetical protein CCR75_001448 [Bremia lactucae]|uniref:non-specific serine/threonine protein kinase n=1 Tax=Bremia lactucae TaxID=4779 RepID=A0A976P058_BRELC|nr:hypothetical protein CCR75_001448 [Bremia lactucae]